MRAMRFLAVVLLAVACFAPSGIAEAEQDPPRAATDLQRLLVRADGYADCDFVMHDYRTGDDTYLKYRDGARSGHERGVGEEDEGSNEALEPQGELPLNRLVAVEQPRVQPWSDVLLLLNSDGQGSAFMISDRVAMTAAHCVYADGRFFDDLRGCSGFVDGSSAGRAEAVVLSVVPKEWVNSSPGGLLPTVSDQAYDYALLVFGKAPTGVGGASSFSLEAFRASVPAMMVDAAGYAKKSVEDGALEDVPGVQLWTNQFAARVEEFTGDESSAVGTFRANVSMIPGMSGGPVYHAENGSLKVVGVVSYTDRLFQQNHACAVSKEAVLVGSWANAGGYNYTAPGWDVDDKPQSPWTGIDDLTDEDVAEQVEAQRALQAVGFSQMGEALGRARAANPEVAAWLYVPGTNVSLPVARHEGDDSFYLAHGADGGDSPIGCPYMEEADSAAFDQPLTVLYGHSFSDQALAFTGLHAFGNEAFFRAHDTLYVRTEDSLLTYRVVEAALYTPEHIAALAGEEDAGALQAYVGAFADADPAGFIGYRRPAALDASRDRVLQLSTCTVPVTPGARFVVSAVLAGEEAMSGE